MLTHEELIQKKGINPSDLPAEIKKAITTVSRLKGRKQTPNMAAAVTKQSLLISQAIIDWIEEDYPEKVAVVEIVAEPVEEVVAPVDPPAEVIIPAPTAAPAVEVVTDSIETKLAAALGEGNRIHYTALKAILGHAPASVVKIGDVRLRRPMLSNWFTKS
jgi:hypothetical protein